MQEDLAGDDEDGDAGLCDGGAHGDLKQARKLCGDADHLAVATALLEEILRMRLLEVSGADLLRWDVRGDGEHGDAAAVTVEEAVDEVQIAGAAASGADGELAGEVRFGSGGEGGDLLVTDVRPFEAATFFRSVSADGIGEAVERVAGESVDASDSAVLQAFNDDVCDCLCHARSPAGFSGSFYEMNTLR